MVYDSITNTSIPTVASNPKDFSKKKRVNRIAKLKQLKLDVRREQWLSQVKNKGFKDENKAVNRAKMADMDIHDDRNEVKLVINSGGKEIDNSINQFSDWDSPSNSPTSHTSSLSSNRSVTNFAGSSSRSSSSSSGGCYSGSMTEDDGDGGDDGGDDGCLDDWEAIADALAADDVKNNPESETNDHGNQDVDSQIKTVRVQTVKDSQELNCRAWRPDDAFRPQGLPNLLKQNSFPMNSGIPWGFKNTGCAPISCPICCEDLDLTDSSFVPCPCGYRLCLFCYKRILEDNGRCPGCREQYQLQDQGNASFKLSRSCSLIPRR